MSEITSAQQPSYRPLARDATAYHVYVRSFQDTNGDGVGDLPGITARLDHIASLGVDGLWLSPFYPSPHADFGYDVSDYTSVDPVYGSLNDFDELVREAHRRNLGVILDTVVCHTSIEHPWFREHPDWYIWSPVDGPANNWVACFGGSAWSCDNASGRWYLHSFYPEQPDLNWRNPEVVEAMHDVLRFWRARGVDGFRLDAIGRLVKDADLRDNPPRSEPPVLWDPPERAQWDQSVHHLDQPETFEELLRLRDVVPGAYIIVEAYCPNLELTRYLQCADTAFAIELTQAPCEARRLGEIIATGNQVEGLVWMLSTPDYSRPASHWGEDLAPVAAMMLLTLPGGAFIYQGDEIGMVDGPAPGTERVQDRAGRDDFRHPMQWDEAGGFTTGEAWLPLLNPKTCNVASQRDDPGSLMGLHRRLMQLRPTLGEGITVEAAGNGILRYRRGRHVVLLNLGETAVAMPSGEVALATASGAVRNGQLAPRSGVVVETAGPA